VYAVTSVEQYQAERLCSCLSRRTAIALTSRKPIGCGPSSSGAMSRLKPDQMELISVGASFACGARFLIDRPDRSAVLRAHGENAGSPLDGPPSKRCAALDMSRDCAWTEAGCFCCPHHTQFLCVATAVRISASIRFSAPAETRPPCHEPATRGIYHPGAINTWRV
jgi:hypothetical protein